MRVRKGDGGEGGSRVRGWVAAGCGLGVAMGERVVERLTSGWARVGGVERRGGRGGRRWSRVEGEVGEG
jgi:hypothetical protein